MFEVIGEGRTAEVLEWEQDRVLKLYREGWGRRFAEHEADNARRLYDAGVRCPAVYGVVEYAGRFGIVYERIAGPSLSVQLLQNRLPLQDGANILAETLAHVHSISIAALPTAHAWLADAIGRAAPLSADQREATLQHLHRLPRGEALCHGDYHPDNILMSTSGPLVIDWENATISDPAADLARTELLLQMAAVSFGPVQAQQAVQDMIAALWAAMLRRYTQLSGIGEAQIALWRLPMAAARLAEGIHEEEPLLLARVAALLSSSHLDHTKGYASEVD
jgi:aminoglycoside phosphotransferase (APT) family kinase protein